MPLNDRRNSIGTREPLHPEKWLQKPVFFGNRRGRPDKARTSKVTTMKRKALILVEGSRNNGQLYVHAAQRQGLHPITLATDPTDYHYIIAESSEAIAVDTEDFHAMLHECLKLTATYDIAGITGFTTRGESIYVTVGKLCQHFNLPGPDPECVERCSDKLAQRQLLMQSGLPVPGFRRATSATSVNMAATDIGLPVIVKPAMGNGSSGVRLCRDAGELAEHTAHLLGETIPRRSSQTILVEEFAEGPFYDVVTMGNEVVAVGSGYFGPPPHFVPYQSIFPAQLTEEQYDHISDISLRCLQALGLGWGPANIELLWTKSGPVIMEVNPRLPGWTTPRLIQLAHGVDIIEQHIKCVIGEECDHPIRQSRASVAQFLAPDCDGTLAHIRGFDLAAAVPGIAEVAFYVEPGVSLVRRGDCSDIIGHIIASSADLTRAEAILRRTIDLIDWEVTPVDKGKQLGT